MGHFEKNDLLDVIRHEMRLDDEDGFGMCGRTMRNVTRRAKYGGLPLDFHRKTGDFHDDSDSDCYDAVYEIPLYEEPLHTRAIINEHLNERTEQKILEEKRVEDNTYKGDLAELFVKRDVNFIAPEYPEDYKSIIDVYLEKNAGRLNNPLSEYAQFAGTSTAPKKTVLIIFPNRKTGDFKSFEICVTCSARVRDVIGYCMLQYFLEFGPESLQGSVEDYNLHLAENDGEVEYDLPPLDRAKLIGQLGFDCLGLVGAERKSGGKKKSSSVIAYFVDKESYVIEVDNMEKPLRWLRDEIMKRRLEDVEDPDDGIIRIKEYYMETVDNFDVRLDLEMTIASARSLEFVMVREKSARAGFHPRGARYGRQMSAMLTLKMPNSPIPAGPSTPLPKVVEEHEGVGEGPMRPMSLSSPTVTWCDGGGQLSCFVVQRCHKFKPNWKAKLYIYWTRLEIDKFSVDKNAFLPQGYQKKTSVPWEYVGGVKVNQKEPKPNRAATWQITIFWLPELPEETISKIVGDGGEWSLQHVSQLYSEVEKWKSIVVETGKKEDCEQIESQIMSILMAREAAIYKTFNHSASGTRNPSASAENAMMDCADALISSPTSEKPSEKSTSKEKMGKIRKMSRILMGKPAEF